jgi:hypothetical protein
MSLRSGIPATPFSVRPTLVLLAHNLLVAGAGRNGVEAGAAVGGQALPLFGPRTITVQYKPTPLDLGW